jgi:hypothetical protein
MRLRLALEGAIHAAVAAPDGRKSRLSSIEVVFGRNCANEKPRRAGIAGGARREAVCGVMVVIE